MKRSHFKTWLGICFLLCMFFHSILKSGSTQDATSDAILAGSIVTLLLAGVWYFVRFITRFQLVKTILGRSIVAVASGIVSGVVLSGMGMESGPGIGGALGLLAMGRSYFTGGEA